MAKKLKLSRETCPKLPLLDRPNMSKRHIDDSKKPTLRWGCRKRQGAHLRVTFNIDAAPAFKGARLDAGVQTQKTGVDSAVQTEHETGHLGSTPGVCSVCLSSEPKNLALVPCGHLFHEKCIDRMISATTDPMEHRPSVCPVCRHEIQATLQVFA